jgi:hypothetical protein
MRSLRTWLHKSVRSGHFYPLTPPMLDYVHSDEILTKHKEAMRQLFKFAKIGLQQLEGY